MPPPPPPVLAAPLVGWFPFHAPFPPPPLPPLACAEPLPPAPPPPAYRVPVDSPNSRVVVPCPLPGEPQWSMPMLAAFCGSPFPPLEPPLLTAPLP